MEEAALERRALIGLHAVPGLGLARLEGLLALAGSARAAAANLPALSRQLEPRWLQAPSASVVDEVADQQLEEAEELGATILCLGQADYPEVFAALEQPPPVLHVLGNPALLQGPVQAQACHGRRVAVIGARGCTPYGREQVRRFGRQLAWAQAVVVSGAARGIDLLGLEAAIEADGKVVAVLGSGLDCPYPQEAIPVLERAVDLGGAVLSEFPFGTLPRPGHFPRRNRLIAALGDATLVVQATRKSGTMNTVDWCLKLDREVYVVPGPLNDHACSGTNLLLAEGAQPALSPEHLLATLEATLLAEECGRLPPLLAQLSVADAGLAELAEVLLQSQDQVAQELLDMELRGLVVRLPDGRYHRTGPATIARAGPRPCGA